MSRRCLKQEVRNAPDGFFPSLMKRHHSAPSWDERDVIYQTHGRLKREKERENKICALMGLKVWELRGESVNHLLADRLLAAEAARDRGRERER